MDANDFLQLIKLLSAIESWSFSSKTRMPDYLLEKLDCEMVRLETILISRSRSSD